MITKENFITANFIDNERKNIEILLRDEKNEKVISHIVEYSTDDPTCQELLKVCPLDQLHENTWQKKKEETKAFEEQIIKIAEKKGLFKKVLQITNKSQSEVFFNALFDFLLSSKKVHIDRLFNFKLFLFELEEVKHSKNEKAKSNIRRAKTPIAAFREYLKIRDELVRPFAGDDLYN